MMKPFIELDEFQCNVGDDDFCCQCAIADEIRARFDEVIINHLWPHILQTEYGEMISRVMLELMEAETIPGAGLIYFESKNGLLKVKQYPSVQKSDNSWVYYDPKYQGVVNMIKPDDVSQVLSIVIADNDPSIALFGYFKPTRTFEDTIEIVAGILQALEAI